MVWEKETERQRSFFPVPKTRRPDPQGPLGGPASAQKPPRAAAALDAPETSVPRPVSKPMRRVWVVGALAVLVGVLLALLGVRWRGAGSRLTAGLILPDLTPAN
jgi:hypothetical protein